MTRYLEENCEGHPDGVEHTHEDGTVHTHPGGDKEHTHDEVEEGTLPPALQKAIDAKKKKGGDDEEDKEKDEGTLPPALQKAIDAKKKGKGDDDEDGHEVADDRRRVAVREKVCDRVPAEISQWTRDEQ